MRTFYGLCLALLSSTCTLERGDEAETTRLLDKGRQALDAGHPHLALLLTQKAPSTNAAVMLLSAQAAAADGDLGLAQAGLERAVDLGLRDTRLVDEDPALAPLRGDFAMERLHRLIAIPDGGTLAAGVGLMPSSPDGGLDPAALDQLVAAAKASRSAALIVLRHGRLVGTWRFGHEPGRIEAMSATKSLVSLAVGLLVDDGRIPSLDTPVSRWFPEWEGTPKAAITVRMLLNHTSGLGSHGTTEAIYAARSFVRFALEAPLVDPPGTKFQYNNSATNLLAGLVESAAGEPVDALLSHRLFGPMGIEDFTWSRDAVGNRHGMSGLQIWPEDFAKVGQLLLQRGQWNGQQLISADWIDRSTGEVSQPFWGQTGLLWWLTFETERLRGPAIEAAARRTGRARIIERLRPFFVEGIELERLVTEFGARLRPFEFRLITRELTSPTAAAAQPRYEFDGGVMAFKAAGYLGQYLVVIPGDDMVVVRMSSSVDQEAGVNLDLADIVPLSRALVHGARDGGVWTPEGEPW